MLVAARAALRAAGLTGGAKPAAAAPHPATSDH
jgi:hypothetical protein